MEIASSFSTSANTVEALKDAYAVLERKLGGAPTWMAVHGTYHHSGEVITTTLQSLAPGVPFQGGSIWITCAPGDEEEILAGIEDGLAGAHVPIIGGSSADNTTEIRRSSIRRQIQ